MHPTEHHSSETSVPIHFEAPKEKTRPKMIRGRYGTVEPVNSLQDIIEINRQERED